MQILYFIQQALIWIITIYWIYQLVVSICSFITLKDKPLLVNKNHKFLAIIPAHNEEAVVGNLIESLKNQNYPKNKLDICVIVDNCTDKTKEVAESYKVKIFERHEEDPAKKTKGDALRLFLNTLLADPKMDYDAFCVFDADNIVDKNFISAMNKHLCQGEEVVQGYRDIKNPTDSWISSGYAIFYWTMNRFYHLARYNAGLSPLINGTGFMVKFDAIRPTGWNTNTLTEDIELAKEWAVCRPDKQNGWVHKFALKLDGLRILDFQKLDVLAWIAELMKHRHASDSKRYRVLSAKFIDRYGVDTEGYDVIKGWRANASYFYIAKEFVRDNVDVDILEDLLSLGGLGIQYCLKTPNAYENLMSYNSFIPFCLITIFIISSNHRNFLRNSFVMV